MRFSGVPGWAIFGGATLVALTFAAGLLGLLLMGRPVPDQLWLIEEGIALFYFGSGPFSVALQHLAQAGQQAGATNTALVDTVNHQIAAATNVATMTTDGNATPPMTPPRNPTGE